ncbi:hypothetical protein EMIHUDRAFT_457761, partial [Emiliania huxleyi CCMP1516]|uniref:Uncharacterized protein n=2 Tax=Emiliania huxleyi TaxID=2903 RepID=A0A0D3JLG4_EMIH1
WTSRPSRARWARWASPRSASSARISPPRAPPRRRRLPTTSTPSPSRRLPRRWRTTTTLSARAASTTTTSLLRWEATGPVQTAQRAARVRQRASWRCRLLRTGAAARTTVPRGSAGCRAAGATTRRSSLRAVRSSPRPLQRRRTRPRSRLCFEAGRVREHREGARPTARVTPSTFFEYSAGRGGS